MRNAQLRTAIACDEMGVSLIKGGGLSGKVLVSPAPKSMAEQADGPVRINGLKESPLLRDPRLDAVWEQITGSIELKEYAASLPVCQLAGGDSECHAQMTVKAVGTGWVRACWVHDQEQHDERRLQTIARHNRAVLSIRKVVSALRLPVGHPLSLPELCWYLTLNAQIEALPTSLQREVLGRPETDMVWSHRGGYVDTDDAFLPLPADQLATLTKPVVSLLVDAEPPLSFIPRPKPMYWSSAAYLRWVKTQECCACGKPADDPHHVIGYGQGKMGGKAHDMLVIPLCRFCHNELHADMWTWERAHGPQALHLQRTLDLALKLGALR